MKKQIFILLLAICTLFSLVGCSKKKELNIICDGKEETIELKKGGTFTCRLLTDDYFFTITEINKKKAVIEASDYGLVAENPDGTISLLKKGKTFTIEKNKTTTIVTQSMDHSETLKITWK